MNVKLVNDRSGKTYLIPEELVEKFYQVRDTSSPQAEFGKWEVFTNQTINPLWMVFPDWDDPRVSEYNYRWVDASGLVAYSRVEPKIGERGWTPRNSDNEVFGKIEPLDTWHKTLECRYKGYKIGQEVAIIWSFAPMKCSLGTVLERTPASMTIHRGKDTPNFVSDQYGFVGGVRRVYPMGEFCLNFGNATNFL